MAVQKLCSLNSQILITLILSTKRLIQPLAWHPWLRGPETDDEADENEQVIDKN